MSGMQAVAEEFLEGADAVLVFTTDGSTYGRFEDEDRPVVVVATENAVGADTFVALPLDFDSTTDRVRFGIEGALDDGIVGEGDDVVGFTQTFDESRLDTIVRVRADEFTRTGLYDLFVNSRADAQVIRDVFDVVIELGKKGQKGKPVGALFVVGDERDASGETVYGDRSHTGRIGHPLGLDFLAYPEHPRAGSSETVQNFDHEDSRGGSWEMQVDLDGEFLAVLPGGNSGRYFSEHYDDQIARWARGEYRSLSRTPEGDLTVEFQAEDG
jgi:DNA integrity scanning protein DisA with diadenylate cyclase activity